jgi:hypothetical protein
MAEGGFNVVWCGEKDLDIVQSHGLRGQLQDGLIAPATLDQPEQREKLDALIERVRKHPALYSYFITDEPNATNFPALGKLVQYLREHDPEHMAYINLFPTYATNKQLGNKGDPVTAYCAHLKEYIETVQPSLVSYDHYQFSTNGDSGNYFLNLALIRQASLDAGLPFLNIVQACTWSPVMRVPNAQEMRYLVYTTLAYGAQGISYYVYCWPNHIGGIANPDGTPTPIYHALSTLNREFVNIARELQPFRSTGVYHLGMLPPGTELPPADLPLKMLPPPLGAEFKPRQRVQGVAIGCFASERKSRKVERPTCFVVVNLDYEHGASYDLEAAGNLEVFDTQSGLWARAKTRRLPYYLPGGGGVLLRIK